MCGVDLNKTEKLIEPDWFDGENYALSTGLGPKDWFNLIEIRHIGYNQALHARSRLESGLSYKLYSKSFEMKPYDYSFREAWPWFGDTELRVDRFKIAKKSAIIPIKRPNQSKVVFSDSATAKDTLGAERDSSSELFDFYYSIDVDLSAPQAKIENDFKDWLRVIKKIRRERLEAFGLGLTEPKYASVDVAIKSLIRHKVLQYFDLYIYFISQGFSPDKITDYKIGKILFPEMDPNTAKKKVKQDTKPLFLQIIDPRNAYLEAFKSLL